MRKIYAICINMATEGVFLEDTKDIQRKMKNGAERRTIGKRDNRTDNKTVEK